MKFECNTCGHAEVCVYKAQYAEFFQALEAAHNKWEEETEGHLRATKEKVFSFKVGCKFWRV